MPHSSDISNNLGVHCDPCFHSHSFMKWPLTALQKATNHTLPGFSSSLKF
ncbi:rCG56973, isoform CRA_a [Rattus norvegicus]|uniref:RCG56973, isoform CRA_a n=1 Tax=Rattus norvegicus TaxID=10116 RepID=A6JD12_RAT|nr:rCG56973, isoform CRA_a [Rattus norvegicus]EDL89935.1 rCG56973, isoform CRA_a [Rattus norvegicus]